MDLSKYLSMLHLSERNLERAFIMVADRHDPETEIHERCRQLAALSRSQVRMLEPFLKEYGENRSSSVRSQMLKGALFHGTPLGALGTLADMQDLLVLASSILSQWLTIHQAATTMGDEALVSVSQNCREDTDVQISWLRTQVRAYSRQPIGGPRL